ncbi:MAG: FAD-linked oxidase [Alphaproteobacteria bacterium 64-6]|nr:MAG: FAD-linked oxidase [Alphaproteobacteria bacterium 64-6]
MKSARPGSERELQRLIIDAVRAEMPVEVLGAGTKRNIGRPVNAGLAITTASLRGVTLYEPTELVMGARAGTPLADIEERLAVKGQMLAFEPIDLGPVLGGAAGSGTIGAVFATNLSGSRRVMSGGARDHLLGIEAITGAGQAFRGGGRVMKNVTGYDLCRAVCGSWGTLAVMTSVIFKVLPRPERTGTLIFLGLDDTSAIEALCAALGTPFEVSGAIHLQAPLAARLRHTGLAATQKAVTAVRIETFESSLRYRLDRLKEALRAFGEIHELDDASSLAFWRELRQLSVLQGNAAPLWRISTAPRSGPTVVTAIARYMECRAFYDWSGGLIWAEVLDTADAGAGDVRRVIASHGGHATLVRAAPAVRAGVDVFQPLEPDLDAITRGIKAVFDPADILNRGRLLANL